MQENEILRHLEELPAGQIYYVSPSYTLSGDLNITGINDAVARPNIALGGSRKAAAQGK